MSGRLLLRVLACLVAAAVLLAGYSVWLASSAPVVRTLRVHLPGWPEGAPPMRLVLMSDLHVSRPGDSPARLQETVAEVNGLHPDLVLLAGDFIATDMLGARSYTASASIAPLGDLRPRLGSYAVLGNHDYRVKTWVRSALADNDIHVLDNRAARVGPLAIVGVSDAFSHHADVPRAVASWRARGGVPIVLTHSPDSIPNLPEAIHLALAGHTHCGQVSVPFFGPPITQSRFGKRYACGVVREGARVSVITAGLGTSSAPIRFAAPPDLWVLEVGP